VYFLKWYHGDFKCPSSFGRNFLRYSSGKEAAQCNVRDSSLSPITKGKFVLAVS